jgi:two-component system cell cycle response regulator
MGARILVIDDDPVNAELAGYLLRAFGHEPVLALGGEPAIDEARNRVPDLVLCDIQMPGVDGFEVLRQLRGDARFTTTAIVGVTALAMVGDHEKIIAGGFDGYLTKPITPETFVEEIERYLPAALAAPRRMPPDTHVVSEEVPAIGAKRSGYALVVDDYAPGRELLRHLIVALGVAVRTASNAEDALAFTRDAPPRLIISDRLAVLEAARVDAILRDVPFLLVSDDAPSVEEERFARNAGANGFVERPIDVETMLGLLAAWMPSEVCP